MVEGCSRRREFESAAFDCRSDEGGGGGGGGGGITGIPSSVAALVPFDERGGVRRSAPKTSHDGARSITGGVPGRTMTSYDSFSFGSEPDVGKPSLEEESNRRSGGDTVVGVFGRSCEADKESNPCSLAISSAVMEIDSETERFRGVPGAETGRESEPDEGENAKTPALPLAP